MMDFLDRIDEQKRFKRFLSLREGALACVYGRRRVGKSRLIEEVIAGHKYDGMAYTPLINLAKEEANKGELPPYEGEAPDLTEYDTVFIGGPVWWGTYPQVMFTFFKKHAGELKGKTVIPFTTHEGSGLANCVEDVKAAFAGANVTKGFSIYGHEVRTERAKVEKWLKSLTPNPSPKGRRE